MGLKSRGSGAVATRCILCLLAVFVAFVGTSYSSSLGRGIVRIVENKSGEVVGKYTGSFALIIGVSDYKNGWPSLPGVKNDVKKIEKILRYHGFYVVTKMNLKHDAMISEISDFVSKYGMDKNNRLLFFFSGHGHTIKKAYGLEEGYIVPADAPNPAADKTGFMKTAIPMRRLEEFAFMIDSKHALFVFDSCFSGNIFSLMRSLPESISYKTSKPVRQFLTSGSANEKVPDESVFCELFVDALRGDADLNKDGYITGDEIGYFLSTKVADLTRGTQHPQYGKIRHAKLARGDFVFQVRKEKVRNKVKLPAAPTQNASFNPEELLKFNSPHRLKEKWAKWQQEMDKKYAKLLEIEKQGLPPKLVLEKGWKAFISAYSQNNPYSERDDDLRKAAIKKIAYWENVIKHGGSATAAPKRQTATPTAQKPEKNDDLTDVVRQWQRVVQSKRKGGASAAPQRETPAKRQSPAEENAMERDIRQAYERAVRKQ